MRLRTVIIVAAGIVVLAVGAAAVVLLTTDFGRYKGIIAEQVTEATGRQFAINGPLVLTLLPEPALTAKDVALANAPWGTRPQMALLGEVEARVALLPLLSRRVEIKSLVLKNVDLLLETDAKGRGNWDFAAPAAPAAEAKPASRPASGAITLPSFSKLQFENVTVSFRDGVTGKSLVASLHALTADRAADGSHVIKASALYAGVPLTLEATIGSLALLERGGTPYPLKGDLSADGAKLAFSGTIAEPLRGHGLDMQVAVDGQDLGTLAALTGLQLPARPYHLAGTLGGDIGGTLSLKGMQASLGANSLNGDGSLTLNGARPRVTAKLSMPVLDLGELPQGGKGGANRAPPRDAPLFSHDPLPLAALRAIDADLAIDIASVKGAAQPLADLSAHIVLDDGRLSAKPLAASISGNPLNGAIEIDSRQNPATVAATLDGKQIDVGGLLAELSGEDLLVGRGDLAVAVHGKGDSPHDVAASLDGRASLVIGRGVIKSRYADLIGDDLLREAFAWAQGKHDANLHCAVADFAIHDGTATVRDMLMDTDAVTMKGEGTVDLGAERLDLVLTPKPKEMSLVNLATPIDVDGSLRHPNVAPDKLGLAKNVATGALTAINPLVALVPLVLDSGGDANPCLAALHTTANGGSQPAAKEGGVAGAAKDVGSKIGNAVKGIGKSIGNLFR